jgi:hypothetical protein
LNPKLVQRYARRDGIESVCRLIRFELLSFLDYS